MSRRALLSAATAVVGAVSGSVLLAASPAGAYHSDRLRGHFTSVRQNSATHAILVRGYAYDPADRSASTRVSILVNGRFQKSVVADAPSSAANHRYHLRGRHGFVVTFRYPRTARRVELRVIGAHAHNARNLVDSKAPLQTSASRLVIGWARRYVGRSPYRWGGSSPSGFDCSGYSMYVYRHAGMRSLPHSAQAQKTSRHMHRISRRQARAGDLVFYNDSSGYAYHVAVYAGHGRQYAATQPGERIKYQRVARGAIFGTDWH